MNPRHVLLFFSLGWFPSLLPALTFSDWRSANFTSAQLSDSTVSGLTADPDADGTGNLQEYVFFGSPLTSEANLEPKLELISGTLALTYRERQGMSDVSIRLQGSDTLMNWITFNTVTEAYRVAHTGYDEVTLLDPVVFNGTKRFLRLNLQLTPVPALSAPFQLSLTVDTPSAWTVTWTDPNTNEVGYAVERQNKTTGNWDRLVTLAADTGTWQHTTADYQTSTTYRVVAIGAGSTELPSAPITLPDTDGDGIPNAFELGASYAGLAGTYASDPNAFSTNGSGVSDGWLAANGYNPTAAYDPATADTDGDGVPDALDGWPLLAWLNPAPLPEVSYAVVRLQPLGWPTDVEAEEIDDSTHILGRHSDSATSTYLIRLDTLTQAVSTWTDDDYGVTFQDRLLDWPVDSMSQDGYVMAELYGINTGLITPSGNLNVIADTFSTFPLAVGPGGVMAIYEWDDQVSDPGHSTYAESKVSLVDANGQKTTLSDYNTKTNEFTSSVGGGHLLPRFINSSGVLAGHWTTSGDIYSGPFTTAGIYQNGHLTTIPGPITDLTNGSSVLNIPAVALGLGIIAHPTTNGNWTYETLKAWNPKTNAQESITGYDVPRCNDRLEIALDDEVIRNGIVTPLADLVSTAWSISYVHKINNNGVILAYGASPNSSPDGPILLVPISISFEPVGDGEAITDNKDPVTHQWMPGKGKRIFPDAKTPTENTPRNLVQVKVATGLPNHDIYLKLFDVDDPSSDTTIDPNDALAAGKGNDNRTPAQIVSGVTISPAPPYFYASNLATFTCKTDDYGVARLPNGTLPVAVVGMQPGDNLRVAVSFESNGLTGLQVDDKTSAHYVSADDSQVSDFNGAVSPLLTVWRKLHVEVDSMDTWQGNKPSPDRTTAQGLSWETDSETSFFLTLTLTAALPQGNNFYAGGRVIVNGVTYNIYSNTETTIKIRKPSAALLTEEVKQGFLGSAFEVFDDDGNGLADHMPGLPLSGVINAGVIGKYTPAYIQLEEVPSTMNPDRIIPFDINDDLTNPFTSLDSAQDMNGSDRPAYWYHYVVIAYQPQPSVDEDPSGEGGYSGATDVFLANGTIPAYNLFSVIYLETLRDVISPTPNWEDILPARINAVIAHEIGHSPGGDGPVSNHAEGGLMGDDAQGEVFTSKTLSRFREALQWQP